MSRTLYINGRFLTQPVTGVQRYSIELLRNLGEVVGNDSKRVFDQIVCLVPPEPISKPNWENIEIRVIGKNKGNIWEQVDLPLYLRGKPLFSPANIGPFFYARQVVTIHDASVFAYPEAYSFMFRIKYKVGINLLSKRAAHVITDSNFSKNELMKYLGISTNRISVIHLGSDHMDSVQPDPLILEKLKINKKDYLLVVSSRSPHKNIPRLIKAANSLKTSVKFLIVGGDFGKVFQKEDFPDASINIQYLGYLTDSEIKTLYHAALGFVFPSLYEGFGLPVLEAMRSKCPVIVSNAASLPEIAGESVLYFDPLSSTDIASKLDIFLSDHRLQERLGRVGYQWSLGYSWSDTAQKAYEIFCAYLMDDTRDISCA